MVKREVFVGREMAPEVGRPKARAERRANEVKKVRCWSEVVWERRCSVATCTPCFGGIGV